MLASTALGLDQTLLAVVITSAAAAIVVAVLLVMYRVQRRAARTRATFTALMESGPAMLDGSQREYVASNWLVELLKARAYVRFNRAWFLTFRFVAVAGALVLPALASQSLGGTPPQAVSVATFVVSVLVAVSAGALQVFKFGNEWGLDEEYGNALEAEGWAYLQKAGHYRDFDYSAGGAFQEFFQRIEDVRRFRGDRRALDIRNMASEASKEPSPPGRSTLAPTNGAAANQAEVASSRPAPLPAPPLPTFVEKKPDAP